MSAASIQPASCRLPHCSFRLIAILLVITTTLQGCITTPGPSSTDYQHQVGKVAIVASLKQPEIEFEGFIRSKGEGAAKGAGLTFEVCVGSLGGGSCQGELCGAFILFWLGVCTVSSAVGAVVGAVQAPSAKEVKQGERHFATNLEIEAIQASLSDVVMLTAAENNTPLALISPDLLRSAMEQEDYRSLSDEVDSVLEVALTKVGTAGAGMDEPLMVYMEVQARLIRARDNKELLSRDYVYHGGRQHLSTWTAYNGKRLVNELKRGYEILGRHIHDQVFMLYPFPSRKQSGTTPLTLVFGLAPINPVRREKSNASLFEPRELNWNDVSSRRPTLVWESFPRPDDRATAAEDMGRIHHIRYDLLIARERNRAPGEIVYWREGLETNQHTLEVSLKPRTRYFWTVRARFELDGRERVTEWSSHPSTADLHLTPPSQASFRFETP